MKLTDYAWEIFDIAKENDIPVTEAKNMFISNLEAKKATYGGADVDYETLGATWTKLGKTRREAEMQVFDQMVNNTFGIYKELTGLRNDEPAFKAAVEQWEVTQA